MPVGVGCELVVVLSLVDVDGRLVVVQVPALLLSFDPSVSRVVSGLDGTQQVVVASLIHYICLRTWGQIYIIKYI